MFDDNINGIPRVDPRAQQPMWKRAIQRAAATKPGAAFHRMVSAPLDAPLLKATGGRMSLAVGVLPVVILTSTGARSGKRRDTPLSYFTDDDDVILVASNYGDSRHPGWYHNLLAHPECELHTGQRGGSFVARQTEGAERERLYSLAVDLFSGYGRYAEVTTGLRNIGVMRLTPAS